MVVFRVYGSTKNTISRQAGEGKGEGEGKGWGPSVLPLQDSWVTPTLNQTSKHTHKT